MDQLLSRYAMMDEIRWAFEEQRESAFLTRPIKTQGVLSYQAPDRLEKLVHEPHSERIVVEGDRLSIESERRQGRDETAVNFQQYAIGRSDVLSVAVETLRATLNGDGGLLRRLYMLEFSGPEEDWRLVLTPRDEKLKEYFETVTIEGDGVVLRSITTVENGGDRAVIRIRPDAED